MSAAPWVHITNWGNSLLLMPVALAIAVGLVVDERIDLAARWSLAFAVGVLFTLATKIAFLGWGIGIAALDFTGVSGHTMLAAAVLPMLAWWLSEGRGSDARRTTIAGAVVLALVIGASRLVLDTHSPSEVLAGFALGIAVAAIATIGAAARRGRPMPRRIVLAALVIGFALPLGRPVVEGPHDLVTRIALGLSGHATVHTRAGR